MRHVDAENITPPSSGPSYYSVLSTQHSTLSLLVAQGFNRIQGSGFASRIVAKEYSHRHREDY